MLAVLFAGVGSLVDGLQFRDRHQATYTMAASMMSCSGTRKSRVVQNIRSAAMKSGGKL
jgi:hypothetical protein